MSAVAIDPKTLLKQAQDWARELIEDEKLVCRKKELAIESLAERLGLTKGAIWNLLYRPPAEPGASLYLALEGAYYDECRRQRRKFDAEARDARPSTGVGRALVRAAHAFAVRDLGRLT